MRTFENPQWTEDPAVIVHFLALLSRRILRKQPETKDASSSFSFSRIERLLAELK
jgi:hypothetical protein